MIAYDPTNCTGDCDRCCEGDYTAVAVTSTTSVSSGPRVYLMATRLAGRWLISRADLQRFMDECTDLSVRSRPQARDEERSAPRRPSRSHRRAVEALRAMGVMA